MSDCNGDFTLVYKKTKGVMLFANAFRFVSDL